MLRKGCDDLAMRGSKLRGLSVVLLMGALLGACISHDTPGDVSFAAVEAVDYYDRPELPSLGDLQMGAGDDTLPKQHKLLLRVQFSTSVDLVRFAKSGGYNLGRLAFFCEQPDEEADGNPYVFWQGENISRLDRASLRENGQEEGPPITYYVFIGAVRGKIKAIPPLPPYDLRRQPRDVCFDLSGGNQMGGYRSNTVVIPQSAISEALKQPPPYFTGGNLE